MSPALAYLVRRLHEPSTWRGLILLLTAAGVRLEPALAEAIIATGLALAGLVGVLTRDAPVAATKTQPDGHNPH